MEASDQFQHPSTRVNDLWQTDFTYFKIIGWGWYYLSTILDDYSRYIITWRLCTSMGARDVADTLDDALRFTGLGQVKVQHKPRLLSDNGPCYISGELSEYLQANGMKHTRGRPYHPQTQGKIERWHRSMKNQILLNNLTPADVFYGRGDVILEQQRLIKRATMVMRWRMHYDRQTIQPILMS